MQLFSKSSNKSKPQQALERENACEPGGCAVEDAPAESCQQEPIQPLNKSIRKDVFQVDLLGAWVKP